MHELTLELFDENLEPIEVTVFYKITKEDLPEFDYSTKKLLIKDYFVSEILPKTKAIKNGQSYIITPEDMDAWENDISRAVNSDVQKHIQSLEDLK